MGAETPEELGDYFAWGETIPQEDGAYTWATYKWIAEGMTDYAGCTKYSIADNQINGGWYNNGTYVGTTVDGINYKDTRKLEANDDAASANWGREWCTPSYEQQMELINTKFTTVEWTTVNGVGGMKVTSKSNGNSIFLPAEGRCTNGKVQEGTQGYGFYWTSDLIYTDCAYTLTFHSLGIANIGKTNSSRNYGLSVRPVWKP